MGGYRSGRPASHLTTEQCVPIDTTQLRKRGYFAGERYTGKLAFYRQRYRQRPGDAPPKEEGMFLTYAPAPGGPGGTLTIRAAVHDLRTNETKQLRRTMEVVTTPCNYGGQRYWLNCPRCKGRVRVVYLVPDEISLACRTCLDLNYPSQRESFEEKQRTQERWLLEQGLLWTWDAWQALPQHYLTPQEEYQARRIGEMRHRIRCMRDNLRLLRIMASIAGNAWTPDEHTEAEQTIISLEHAIREQEQALKQAA